MQRKRSNRTGLQTVAILGDGMCEQMYFRQMRDSEGIRYHIKPELPNRAGKGGGFQRVFDKAEELKKDYDHVLCLIDLDVVFRDRHQEAYQKKKKRIQGLGIKVIECNPCFEVWFLLHFQRTGRLFNGCSQVERTLRQETDLNDYSKEQIYFERKNLYQALYSRLYAKAIPNAEWLEKQNDGNQGESFPKCEVFKAINFLLPK